MLPLSPFCVCFVTYARMFLASNKWKLIFSSFGANCWGLSITIFLAKHKKRRRHWTVWPPLQHLESRKLLAIDFSQQDVSLQNSIHFCYVQYWKLSFLLLLQQPSTLNTFMLSYWKLDTRKMVPLRFMKTICLISISSWSTTIPTEQCRPYWYPALHYPRLG